MNQASIKPSFAQSYDTISPISVAQLSTSIDASPFNLAPDVERDAFKRQMMTKTIFSSDKANFGLK